MCCTDTRERKRTRQFFAESLSEQMLQYILFGDQTDGVKITKPPKAQQCSNWLIVPKLKAFWPSVGWVRRDSTLLYRQSAWEMKRSTWTFIYSTLDKKTQTALTRPVTESLLQQILAAHGARWQLLRASTLTGHTSHQINIPSLEQMLQMPLLGKTLTDNSFLCSNWLSWATQNCLIFKNIWKTESKPTGKAGVDRELDVQVGESWQAQ